MRGWWTLLIALVAATVLAIVATTPPAPTAVDAAAPAFSAGRAMNDVRAIARAPHPTGSDENVRVTAYLVAQLRALGLEVGTTTSPLDAVGVTRLDAWRGHPAPPPPVVNVVATLPGKERALPAVLMMAHHDSVWGSPGAADDSAGVAAILETVRALKAQGPARRDLIVLLTDGEELGLEGAKAFFATDPRRARVGVIVNLETRGGGGRAAMFETGAHNGAMMRLFGDAVRAPVATSLSTFIYQKLPNSTDYTVAKKLGVPGFNFAFIGRSGLYHSPLATPDRLDQGAVQDMGRQALDLTRALLDVPALPGAAPDRVFFDAFGLFLIGYPAVLGWLLLGIAVAGYTAAAWRRARAGEVARGAGTTLALIVGGGLLLYLVNIVSGAGAPTNYYDRLAAIPRLELQALALCLAAMAALWGLACRRSLPDVGFTAGLALPMLLLATVAQALAPTAAFVFTMPLLLGGLAQAMRRALAAPAGVIAEIVAAALGIGHLAGFGFFLLQAVGPDVPVVAVVPLALSMVLATPLLPRVTPRQGWRAAAGLIALAIVIALWVRLDPVAPSAAVYSVFK